MSAHIDLDAIRAAWIRRRHARYQDSPIGESSLTRKSLPTVERPSREAQERADFIRFPPEQKDGTRCTNCMYHEDHVCQYNDKVDLRGLEVFEDTCCAFWDTMGATRPWQEGETRKAFEESKHPRDDSGEFTSGGGGGAGKKPKKPLSAAARTKKRIGRLELKVDEFYRELPWDVVKGDKNTENLAYWTDHVGTTIGAERVYGICARMIMNISTREMPKDADEAQEYREAIHLLTRIALASKKVLKLHQSLAKSDSGKTAKDYDDGGDGMSWKGSYFQDCERDDKGRCLPKGQSEQGGQQGKQRAKTSTKKAVPAAKPKGKRIALLNRFQDIARKRMVLHALRNEKELSDAIGGFNLPDSEPADVVFHVGPSGETTSTPEDFKRMMFNRREAVKILRNKANESAERIESARRVLSEPLVFFEVKTLHTMHGQGRIKMSPAAQRRKRLWERRYGAKFKTVAIDDRKSHHASGHRLYFQDGIGNMRVAAMQKANDFEDVLGRAMDSKKSAGDGLTRKADTGTKGAGMWITIGGHAEEGKEHVGGVPVLIDGRGNIIGGSVPRSLHGTNVGEFKERIEAHRGRRKEAEEKEQKYKKSPFGEAMHGLREGKKTPLAEKPKEPAKPSSPKLHVGSIVSSRRKPGRKGEIVSVGNPEHAAWVQNMKDPRISWMTPEQKAKAYPEPSRTPTHARVKWTTGNAFHGGKVHQTVTVRLADLSPVEQN